MKGILSWFVPQELKFFDMLRRQSENVLYGANQFKEFMFMLSQFSNATLSAEGTVPIPLWNRKLLNHSL